MTEKTAIVYIGPKPQKKIVVNGKHYVFPQGKPISIIDEEAYQLLQYPTVFQREEDAKDAMVAAEEKAEKEAKRLAAIEAVEKEKSKTVTYLVLVDGEAVDISKYTSPKLRTIIEAEELLIDYNRKQLAVLRDEVRDALHEKHGVPEVEA